LAEEVEPDLTTADAAALTLTGNAQVTASLTAGDDDYDVFVVSLESRARLVVRTGDGAGGCPRDTQMYQIDGAILDADGIDAAVDRNNALGYDDDGGFRTCSQFSSVREAGTYYFAVREYNLGADIPAYVLTALVTPVVGDGELCDDEGRFLVCDVDAGFSCSGPDDDDGVGVCQP
jgi:hypothetical protein